MEDCNGDGMISTNRVFRGETLSGQQQQQQQHEITMISSVHNENTYPLGEHSLAVGPELLSGVYVCSISFGGPAGPHSVVVPKKQTRKVHNVAGGRMVFIVLFSFFVASIVAVVTIKTNPSDVVVTTATTTTATATREYGDNTMKRIVRRDVTPSMIQPVDRSSSHVMGDQASLQTSIATAEPTVDRTDRPARPSREGEWNAVRDGTTTNRESTAFSLQTRSEAFPVAPASPETKSRSLCNNEIAHPPLPGKRGAAFTLRDEGQNGSWVENLPKVIRLEPYWNYSWGTKRIAAQPDNIEFIPMLWGYYGSAGLRTTIANYVLPLIQSGQVKRLMAYNEPDNPSQSNLSVERALESWPILEQTNLPLISPSCQHPDRDVRCYFMIVLVCHDANAWRMSLLPSFSPSVDAEVCHQCRPKLFAHGMGGCSLVRWYLL
jgi:Glycosyl hydrolase catalytic core